MNKKQNYNRSAGVLMPIPMLHGAFGIGNLGQEAMDFIDFLKNSGFHAWQVLPVEQTGSCFSPYKCISTYAGEPMLIDPRGLLEMGLITEDELSARAEDIREDSIDYDAVYKKQWALLAMAFNRLEGKPYAKFAPFWLEEYALYMAIKMQNHGTPWFAWEDEGLRSHAPAAIKAAKKQLAQQIAFYKFVQWLFDVQWRKLKQYAAKQGIAIVGDIPIYVSEDSVEVWSKRDLFDADASGKFPAVGGAPPDYFAPEGQRWGNPIYNWKRLKDEGYEWWINRVRAAIDRYDMVRLDHFRGFDRYWQIPFNCASGKDGKWVKGPGMPLFDALQKAIGDLPLIAEDLGADIGEGVETLLNKTGIRGMRVLQFGFDGDGQHLPHSFTPDRIVYTGTHDNTTLLAWLFELPADKREQALFYIGFEGDWTIGGVNSPIIQAWIRTLFMSAASLVIVPIQDLLGYGADTRTNTPGTVTGNWRFRIRTGAIEQINSAFYRDLSVAYARDNQV